jgi:hypothetical protein
MTNDRTTTFAVVVFVAICLGVGAGSLLFPKRVQEIAIHSLARGPAAGVKPLSAFVASKSYLWHVRLIGVVCILMATLATWVRFR